MKRNIILNRHFSKRMEERIGIPATRRFRNYVLSIIQDNKAELLQRQSNSRGLYIVPLTEEYKEAIGRNELFVIYNKVRKKLVTVLEYTPEQVNEFRKTRNTRILEA
jgi:predicted RNA-binding protein YlxR (DUF448 family)